MIRVGLVAPALAIRSGLQVLLGQQPDLEVIWDTASLEEIADWAGQVDVLVLTTTAATRKDLEESPLGPLGSPGVLLLGEDGDVSFVLSGLPVRGWGILPLDASAEELAAAVRAVHEGLVVGAAALLEPLMAQRLVGKGDGEDIEALTERELQVLGLLASGMANKQIASALNISEHTVKFHVSSIYAKLGATNRAEAVRLGARRGLILI